MTRDGGSARGGEAVAMRHGSRFVSVGTLRAPGAPVEPPSVAAGESLRAQSWFLFQESPNLPAHPGHASLGRRHNFPPAECNGHDVPHKDVPAGVNAPPAPAHRLGVRRPSVIVSAQGPTIQHKECASLSDGTAVEQPGGDAAAGLSARLDRLLGMVKARARHARRHGEAR